MNRNTIFTVTGVAIMLASGSVMADADVDLDATIRMMGNAEAELPEAVTKEITLPENVGEDSEALDASADGLGIANDARMNAADGLAIAADAIENAASDARETAADMADAAGENAENSTRADELIPELPDVVPPTGR